MDVDLLKEPEDRGCRGREQTEPEEQGSEQVDPAKSG